MLFSITGICVHSLKNMGVPCWLWCLLNQPRHFFFLVFQELCIFPNVGNISEISAKNGTPTKCMAYQCSPNSAKEVRYWKWRPKVHNFGDFGDIGGLRKKSQHMTYSHYTFPLFRDLGNLLCCDAKIRVRVPNFADFGEILYWFAAVITYHFLPKLAKFCPKSNQDRKWEPDFAEIGEILRYLRNGRKEKNKWQEG